jgi:hypothetical protein
VRRVRVVARDGWIADVRADGVLLMEQLGRLAVGGIGRGGGRECGRGGDDDGETPAAPLGDM